MYTDRIIPVEIINNIFVKRNLFDKPSFAEPTVYRTFLVHPADIYVYSVASVFHYVYTNNFRFFVIIKFGLRYAFYTNRIKKKFTLKTINSENKRFETTI